MIIISVLLVLTVLFFFYIKNINIYEPISIDFSGISSSDKKNIELYSISPLNRKTNLNGLESINGWNNHYFYHKNIGIKIPDSLVNKISSVDVFLNGEKNKIRVKELILNKKHNDQQDFTLPEKTRSKFTLYKISKLLIHVSIFRYFLVILLCASILLITIHKIIILKNEDFKTKFKRILPWIKTIVFSIIIAIGLFYGFLLLKFAIASYITSVLLILFVMILLWFMTKIILKIFKVSEKATGAIKKTVLITGVVWFCVETFLRITGVNESFNEKNGLYYSSGYNVNSSYIDAGLPDIYARPRYSCMLDKRKEFAYQINANNEGLRDVDRPITKPDSEYRIICLGNSFTEGIGAPQDSTWPYLLEDKLIKSSTNKNISVFNAGISSSDPFFQYNLLEKKLLKYSPDLVLLAPGSSDFEFYNFRGGFERFTPEGLRFREAPSWEKIYAASYIFRFFINNGLHYRNLLSQKEFEANLIDAKKDIYECIYKFYDLSKKNNFLLIVVFVDDRMTLYFPMISELKREKTVPVIDLFEYNRTVKGEKMGYRSPYYWKIDGHCNSKGYDLFAEGIMWNLKRMGIIDSINHIQKQPGK